MKKAACTALILGLVACRQWDVPRFTDDTLAPNATIGYLRECYGGSELTVADSVVIAGRVVSSDAAGNFYNTFFIDDGTGAVEIMAGMPNLDALYHPGQRVSVSVRSLAVGWRDGAMQIGLPPEPGNRYPTGYFYHEAVIRHYVTAGRSVGPPEPVDVTLAELDPAMCGRLVRIGGLRLDSLSAAVTWASAKPSPTTGYVKFRSRAADSITVVTSGYATFALAPVPREEVTLTGVLLYGNGESSREHYMLRLRDEDDIEF